MIGSLLKCLAILAAASFVNILYNLYKIRMHVRRVKTKYGVEILPHSFLWGHLLVVYEVMQKSKLPPESHGQWLALLFLDQYPEIAKKGALYLDLWPIVEPMLIVYNPEMLVQLTDGNFPKSPMMKVEMGPATGAKDILTSEGPQWKKARTMFNPGFSAKNLTSLIPEFVEDMEMFQNNLARAASSGEIIKLEDLTTKLAVDIIGRAVLGVNLGAQVKLPPLVTTMQSQVALLYNKLDPYKALNPMWYFKLWLYRRRFRSYLVPYIRDTVENYEKSSVGTKTILKLALKERADQVKDFSSHLDDFIEDQVGQFWMFLFAGHETTAVTLSYAFYFLSLYPEKAATLRAEHDRVLGTDPSQAAEKFRNNPSLINQLPYTAAVYKETLRLFPPVTGGVRSPSKGFFLTHPDTGERFPAWGFMVNAGGAVMQRLPEYWVEPNTFLPERWLASDPSDPLYPRKGAYRPFEAGPRNCIGQELTGIEMKLALAMTVRNFDVVDTYPEDGPTFFGAKAYQIDIPESVVTAHAKDGMPVRVKARK